jgi:glycosyltransferase involved in cell wall biosynthesis
LVRAFPFRSLFWKWRVRRLAAQGRSHEAYLQTDSAFASAVARLKLPPHDVFFGYSYASLEMLAAEKKRGVLTVLDQIDPGAVEFRIVADEMKQHPEIAGPPPEFPSAYYERSRREWELADVIVVNSEWTREAIIAEGAERAKIEILPLAYETVKETTGPRDNGTVGPKVSGQWSVVSSPSTVVSGHVVRSPLKVLWLGQVNVRKGIHYLMAAAKLLANEPVHFNVVGPIYILPAAVASASRSMTFHGPISRDRAAEWYRQSDVFVLPTLSDGFAITQLEAMAHGLPVVTTPCCGDVVSDGVDGFIVPPRDADALVKTFQRYLARPDLLRSHQTAAFAKSKQFTLQRLSDNLLRVEMALG